MAEHGSPANKIILLFHAFVFVHWKPSDSLHNVRPGVINFLLLGPGRSNFAGWQSNHMIFLARMAGGDIWLSVKVVCGQESFGQLLSQVDEEEFVENEVVKVRAREGGCHF